MSNRKCTGAAILVFFLLGWVTHTFALFNVGRFSITLFLIASIGLGIIGLKARHFLSFPLVSLLLSGLLAWVVAFLSYDDIEKTTTHLIQYMIAIGVMVGASAIDWPRAFPRFQRAFFWVALSTLIYAGYQYFARKYGWPFAFLPITNLQLGADEGLQRGVSNVHIGAGVFTRVSSFFAEPSDLGRFMLWVSAVGFACNAKRLRFGLMGVGIAGVLVSQSMGGIIGLIALAGIVTLLKWDLRRALLFILLGVISLLALNHFAPDSLKGIETRTQAIATEQEDFLIRQGRFSDVPDNIRVFMEAPLLGHGLASLKKIIPSNIVASTWELLLIERGILGLVLFTLPFLWFLFRLGLSSRTYHELQYTAFLVLFVETFMFLTFSALYFPSAYFALGFALYAARYVSGTSVEVTCTPLNTPN